ncbi:MAG: hypothetical protein CMB34_06705 [Euryarchaeota archaeon]|nr:hypothetical protein [Euryarchaeota archaeon]|tara:strand:- start:835 stop:1461 length:627 start_codon:yes stop_codon:yes gene_type:complete
MASTKLDLVNDVLERIGKLPVSNLATNTNSLAGLVERMIDASDRELQARGWHFNSKRNVQLTANSDGRIIIDTIEGSREIFQIDSDAEDAHIDVVRRDSILYNLNDNTDQISSIKVQYTFKVDLVTNSGSDPVVPESFRNWVVSKTARRFDRSYNKEDRMTQVLVAEEQLAQSNFFREEMRNADVRVLDTEDMAQIRGRRRTMNRSIF